MTPTSGRVARRRLVIGDEKSPPKRIRIDVLETLVHQLKETVLAVSKDLGLPEDAVSPLELVDLEGGSCRMVWEQSTSNHDIQAPLAYALEGLAAKSKGRPYRSILTDVARRSIDDLAAVCSSFGAVGIPIGVEEMGVESSYKGPI